MKISTARRLLVALDFVLLLGIGGVVFGEFKAKDTRKREMAAFNQEVFRRLEATAARDTAADAESRGYGNLQAPPIFGMKKVEEAPVVPVDTPTAAAKRPLDDLVAVKAIQAGPLLISLVHLKPKDETLKDEERFYAIGESVAFADNALILRILPQQVVFLYQGEEVALTLDPFPADPAGGAVGATEGPAVVVPQNALENPSTWIQTRPNSANVTVTRVGVEVIRQNEDKILENVTLGSETLADGRRAVRVEKLPPNSALRAGGLEDGDTIESINDVRVSSKAEIVAFVKANPDLPRYTVKILRRGQTITRTVVVQRK